MHDAPVPLVELPLAGAFNAMDLRRGTTVLIAGVKEEKREQAHISTPTTSRSRSYLSR